MAEADYDGTMTLVQQVERLVFGANIALEKGQKNVPEWLAGEFAKIYAGYAATQDVAVSFGADSVTIQRPGGMIRALRIDAVSKKWELTASATVPAAAPHAVDQPGPIASILSDP